MTSAMNTRVVESGAMVVEISGRLHLGNSLSSMEASIKGMIAEGNRKMIIDLAELQFIDSAGVGMLISCGGDMDHAGGAFRVAGAQGPVAKIFETVHMGRIVELDEDVETACRRLAG
jgi:anti-sigma B factor antagonist